MFRAFITTARTIGALYLRFGNDKQRILQIYNREAPIKRNEKGGSEDIGNDVQLTVYWDQRFSIRLELSQVSSTSRLTKSDV